MVGLSRSRLPAPTGGIVTGPVIGAAIAVGWLVTSFAYRHAFEPVQIEAGSFVVPVADTILQFITYTGVLPDYGVGLIVGVVFGAAPARCAGVTFAGRPATMPANWAGISPAPS